MAFEHQSGVPAAYDRAPAKEGWSDVVVREDRFAQGAEINELQTIERRRNRRIANLTAKDGDRIDGGEITVSENLDGQGDPLTPRTMRVGLNGGRVYVAGDVLPVSGKVYSSLPLIGETTIGVRLIKTVVTELDDPDLLGLHPGSEGEGEPGAARLVSSIDWALPDDGQPGEFFAVYLILDGAPINQAPPPALTGINQQIARYDSDANGNYIVDGCEVTAMGLQNTSQVFSIGAGTANISGFKRIRETSLRYSQLEEPLLEAITAEPHTFTGPDNGTSIIPVSRAPISEVQSVIVVKRVTESVVRGTSPNGLDDLQFSSVVAIESVTQGATTYAPTTSYVLTGDAVSWAPGGPEPATGSTYAVTYRYNASVTPDAVSPTEVTVSGGVSGSTALISYTSKVPRIDILCLDISGRPVYLKGISARAGGLPPLAPANLLKLAEVHNSWLGAPRIVNNGTRNYTYDQQRRLFNRLIDVLEVFERNLMRSQVMESDPVAKRGIFTDPLVDDFYRDQGEAQTAAINRGVLQLAIDAFLVQRIGSELAQTLPFVEEVVIRQDLATSSIEINPYDNFVRMPAGMRLQPAVDFWTEEQTEWLSPITREFTTAPNEPPGQTTITEVTEIRRVNASVLRQINVTVTLQGFGVGENLAALTFDGVDVKPPGTQTGDANGEIEVTFTIPANIPVGRRRVRATGAVDSFAEAIFAGEGTIDISTMRRVTLVTREAEDPTVTVINTTTVVQQTIINNTTTVVTSGDQGDNSGNGGGGDGGGSDPLAQTFTLPEPRHVVGVNFKFTTIGDRTNGVRVQLATMQNGFPTREVLAEAFINMQTVGIGIWTQARFAYPVYLPADREFCFVILTSDPDHAVAIAKLGDIDVPTQKRVAAQAYTVGVLLTSANRLTWTPYQEADLTFQIVGARFTSDTRAIDLWSGELDAISDIILRGAIELPTQDTRFRYELVRESGQVIQLQSGQTREFSEYLSEDVTVRAVLDGTPLFSPVLFPGSMLIGGRIRSTGTYVTRAFTMGVAVKIRAIFAALLPAGSSVTVDVDKVDDVWTALASAGGEVIGGGWVDTAYEKASHSATQGRVRITLNGGPGARPYLSRIRSYSV